ncbi:hypothetical protein VTK26DRAFT_1212 [Humicola hyalothermophila]
MTFLERPGLVEGNCHVTCRHRCAGEAASRPAQTAWRASPRVTPYLPSAEDPPFAHHKRVGTRWFWGGSVQVVINLSRSPKPPAASTLALPYLYQFPPSSFRLLLRPLSPSAEFAFCLSCLATFRPAIAGYYVIRCRGLIRRGISQYNRTRF